MQKVPAVLSGLGWSVPYNSSPVLRLFTLKIYVFRIIVMISILHEIHRLCEKPTSLSLKHSCVPCHAKLLSLPLLTVSCCVWSKVCKTTLMNKSKIICQARCWPSPPNLYVQVGDRTGKNQVKKEAKRYHSGAGRAVWERIE